ncbi:MAG TPA: bifunctional adenosylcobinamide kinase/adenosylcobinamide-phosphate guanylyltransferase [Methylomusa anaerophila]|uniref:Adenosylcobinamide kinase n=1 Tax=Methylomusa anaerophila TaxID=1930071 RepID=A0A348AQD8_9FIRM|nr:bifunctional adenosylcobinamide kinase/adenosylcobinamide-phosphate guanylyltransferase [Methylomusa anaerophila]BBB93286.1 bifunctional adenosylcobalamin biosynthesis protein CobU [Methylomusa anaerophila]HML86883.1 bifunctional adenosylcobinamide kinase/adenosylcobinamide-phosphate guanylyltransferase [Methylomusa anaerophila]
MAGKFILVTGGARSGKSLFAEKLAERIGDGRVAYIATAQIYDDEMKDRVALHRSRRPQNWRTYEAPYNAEQAMTVAVEEAGAVLFDCLTLYTSNLLLAPDAPQDKELRFHYIMDAMNKLFARAKSGPASVIFVTNEVGMGIVPENALAREYRDAAGSVNQMATQYADQVYLVVSGLAVDIKKLAANWGKEDANG